jgi:hypothetical protein
MKTIKKIKAGFKARKAADGDNLTSKTDSTTTTPPKKPYTPKLYNLPNTPENLKNKYSSTMRAGVIKSQTPAAKQKDALRQDSIAVNNGAPLKKGGKVTKKCMNCGGKVSSKKK